MKETQFSEALNKLASSLKDLSYSFHAGGEALGALRFENERLSEAAAGISTVITVLGDRTYKAAWDLDGYAIWIDRVVRGHKDAPRHKSRSKRRKG